MGNFEEEKLRIAGEKNPYTLSRIPINSYVGVHLRKEEIYSSYISGTFKRFQTVTERKIII